ncbi:MAG: hypothetical protein ACRC33_14105 [Gemmataceae bacterium]
MFGLETVADWFDEIHNENKQFLQKEFQGWVDEQYQKHGEGWQFYGVAAGAATLEAMYTFSGGVASGFVDTLRIGEGLKEGTATGVLKDGLRALTVVGGAAKVVRVAAAEVKIGGWMSCTFSSSAKAAALSGRQSVQTAFQNLAKGYGGASTVSAPTFAGTSTPLALASELKAMGGNVSMNAVQSLDEVAALARHAKGPVVFGVRWAGPAGTPGGGHTMVAFRDIVGRIRFADQSGKVFKSVSQLGPVAEVYQDAMIVHDAAMITVLKAGTVAQVLGANLQQVDPVAMSKLESKVREKTGRPSPLPPPTRKPVGAKPAPAGTPTRQTNQGLFSMADAPMSVTDPSGSATIGNSSVTYYYTVRPGDTLQAVARTYYGGTQHAAWLRSMNAEAVGAGQALDAPLPVGIGLKMP